MCIDLGCSVNQKPARPVFFVVLSLSLSFQNAKYLEGPYLLSHVFYVLDERLAGLRDCSSGRDEPNTVGDGLEYLQCRLHSRYIYIAGASMACCVLSQVYTRLLLILPRPSRRNILQCKRPSMPPKEKKKKNHAEEGAYCAPKTSSRASEKSAPSLSHKPLVAVRISHMRPPPLRSRKRVTAHHISNPYQSTTPNLPNPRVARHRLILPSVWPDTRENGNRALEPKLSRNNKRNPILPPDACLGMNKCRGVGMRCPFVQYPGFRETTLFGVRKISRESIISR